MKTLSILLAVFAAILLTSVEGWAQRVGDYRSNGTGGGNWSVPATWQRWNGTTWAAATTPPSGTAQTITIRSTDSVYIDVAATIADTLKNQGRFGGGSNLTIGATGIYQHDMDAGSLPFATWSPGSTLYITGSTSVAPTNRNQNFYNVVFDTPGLLSNLNMGWDSVTIGGQIRVLNTGSARWYMSTATAGDSAIFTVMGDVIVTNGQFSVQGTSNANTKFVVHHYGNVIVTGGNLSIARGSQGGGTTRWNLHSGNFSMSNATTQNSNAQGAWFVFDKRGTQTLTLGAGNTLTSLPIEVKAGTRLDMGQSKLRGSGLFTLNPGAMLITAIAGGVDSAVSVTGTVTMTGASFMFNGTGVQVTGMTMPTSVDTLAINTVNSADTVRLSQPTTITGRLRLMRGVFDNRIPFTLGPGASISYEGGTLLVTSVEEDSGLPTSFYVKQNYPNPFNPATTIQYGLPQAAFVTIKVYNLIGQQVATVFAGQQPAGRHTAVIDARSLGSGVYFYRVQAGSLSITRKMVVMK